MNIIYEPRGKAREYADLALNIYKGCTHGCQYCFGAKTPWVPRERYYEAADPKRNVVKRVERDASKLNGNCPEILLSFLGDVYQPAEMELGLTREVLKVLMGHDLPFTVLTKGGMRAVRDFDLLASYPKARFGTTLVFMSKTDTEQWEPSAPTPNDRIAAIELAHRAGIKTWVSLEPVIDPEQALNLIWRLHRVVDHWKVGKINYNKEIEQSVDWITFRKELRETLELVGASYYLKKSLTEL